ncbi:hypothetical protein [Amycolatopsis sp. CA-126428]|uniref:hypothetical protein n=1 Tax=Amycolatopsis sp. CA-126428 TaxID=2073158 RepID=UPI0011B00E06|nr:hypothetical protein [Amycolatopsis sp. CA-126428]
MGNRGGISIAAGVFVLLTACSAAEPIAQTAPPTPAVSSPKPAPVSDAPALGPGPGSPAPTTPQPPPPHSPDKVTSACPFLGVTDASAAMSAHIDAYAVEEAPDKRPGITTYHCAYASRTGGLQIHDLFVTVIPGTGQFASLLKEWTTDCDKPATPIAGMEATARTCALSGAGQGGDVMILVGKKGHGETRLAEFHLWPTRSDVYPKIAQLLLDRL